MRRRRLRDGFRFGEFLLGVDAAHVILLDFDCDRGKLHAARDLDRIRQIKFAFAILVADPFQDGKGGFAGKRHNPAVAEFDGLFSGAGVGVLANGDEFIALRDQPSVAGRIGRPKCGHRHGRACGERAPATA